MTRERWLQLAAVHLGKIFAGVGHTLPAKEIRISCGWPTSRGIVSATSKSRTVGQCFAPEASANGTRQIFVSPYVGAGEQAAAVLAHELVHTLATGHGAPFKRIALAIGLTGKMTSTVPGELLTARLNAICKAIGPYPHASVDVTVGAKKQSTRLLKIECPNCGYTARTTAKWIEAGLPTCPCGTEMEEPEA